jgi:DNA-binding transcriptional LysR family regulator
MRDFDVLDTNSFKAFWAASELLNFTNAARSAGLTQSGISQHIAKLEQQLGAPLFERINRKVHLTPAGVTLRAYIDEYLDRLERLKEEIHEQNFSLSGSVSYAMPASCLMSPHLALMLKKKLGEFPSVNLDIQISTNEDIVAKVLNKEIHFGFITKKIEAPGLKLTPYCQERYLLVGSELSLLKQVSASNLRTVPFVAYPGVNVMFDHWKRIQFPKSAIKWESLNIKGSMNSLAGAINMIEGGVGLSVVPEHCVDSALKRKSLFSHSPSLNKDAMNTIYLVFSEGAHLPRRVKKVVETFLNFV